MEPLCRSATDSPMILLDIPGNDCCADCSKQDPTWASLDFGVLLCHECCGVHRGLPGSVRGTRSLTLDKWTFAEIESVKQRGNREMNRIWEFDVGEQYNKPHELSNMTERVSWITAKWVRGMFREGHPPHEDNSQATSMCNVAETLARRLDTNTSNSAPNTPTMRTRVNPMEDDDTKTKIAVVVFPPSLVHSKSTDTFCRALRAAFSKSDRTHSSGGELETASADWGMELHAVHALRLSRSTKIHEKAWPVLEMVHFAQELMSGDRMTPTCSAAGALKTLAKSAGGKCPLVVVGIGTGCLEAFRFLQATAERQQQQQPIPVPSPLSFPQDTTNLPPPPQHHYPQHHHTHSATSISSSPQGHRLTTGSRNTQHTANTTSIGSFGESGLASLPEDGSPLPITQRGQSLDTSTTASSDLVSFSDMSSLDVEVSCLKPTKADSEPNLSVLVHPQPESVSTQTTEPEPKKTARAQSQPHPRNKEQSTRDASPLELGQTVCLLVTAGCPLPLVSPTHSEAPRCPFTVPHKRYTSHLPRPVTSGWLNFHGKDDPFSFPMQGWFHGTVVTDVPVGCKESSAYMKDKVVIRGVADRLRKIWNSAYP